MQVFRRLIGDDRAQDLAEYAIALAVIAAAAGIIAAAIGTDVNSLWSNTQPKLQTVINSE